MTTDKTVTTAGEFAADAKSVKDLKDEIDQISITRQYESDNLNYFWIGSRESNNQPLLIRLSNKSGNTYWLVGTSTEIAFYKENANHIWTELWRK